jgi:two-component system sensor histidine kinase BaeS
VQHAGAGARVTVTTRRAGTEVLIEVTDTGPGIPADQLPHLFDRFYRGTSRAGGAGLGLAIVDSLLRAMSGRIAVDSTIGTGTTFSVRLPATVPS